MKDSSEDGAASAGYPGRGRLQLLPFTVKLVTTQSELEHAVAVRAHAYLRHNAPAADKLHVAEDDDVRGDTAVLVARSKLDGGVLGSIRINPNSNAPMKFESSVRLAMPQSKARCVEFMRLGVMNGSSGRLVTAALAKAAYYACVAAGIDYIFVASRPPVDLLYKSYLFDDHLQGGTVEIHYAPGVQHSILCLPVAEAEQRWRLRSRLVHRFFVETDHPDLQIDHPEIARRFRPHGRQAPGTAAQPVLAVAG